MFIMNKLADNIYKKYIEKEWSKKFQCAGIYSISLNGKIVYIGKSKNILYRMAEHWASILRPQANKYKVLSEAKKRNLTIKFDVIYQAKSKSKKDIEEEIGEREGFYIRTYLPPLNNQIPLESNWRSYTTNPNALQITLDQILNDKTL